MKFILLISFSVLLLKARSLSLASFDYGQTVVNLGRQDNGILDDLDYPYEKEHARFKRSMSASMDGLIVNISLVETSASSNTSVNIGDVFVYNVSVDLPQIEATNSTDLNLEIFAISATTGIGGYCICNPTLVSKGSNVQAGTPNISYVAGSLGALVRSILTVPSVNTGGNTDGGTKNTMLFQFQAMLCDLPEVTQGSIFYLTVGVEYDDEAFVWVGQIQMTSFLTDSSGDTDVSFSSGLGATINQGDGQLVEVNAFSTVGSAAVTLEVYQAQGYDDIFNIGEMSVTTGAGFSCAVANQWTNTKQLSPSGLSTTKNTMQYSFLINTSPIKNITLPDNQITFEVPISVLNLPDVPVNVSRDLAFVLTIGDNTIWTGIYSVLIGPYKKPPTGAAVTNVANLSPLSETVFLGDSAKYQFEMSIPTGWVNFNVILTGVAGDVIPVLARPLVSGFVAYIPPWFTVAELSTDGVTLNVNFATIKNPSSSATKVVLEVAFKTNGSSLALNDKRTVKCTIGGVATGDMQIQIANGTGEITVNIEDYPISPNTIIMGGQVCMDFTVNIPSGAATPDLIFEVVPDTSSTLNTRVCKAEIKKIGSNLPCIAYNTNPEAYLPDYATYSQSVSTRPLNDYGSLDIGNACPATGTSGDNSFLVTGCMELPVGQTTYVPTTMTLNVNFGLYSEDSTIWVSSSAYNTNSNTTYYTKSAFSDYNNGAGSVIPYVFALEERTSIDAGGANQFQILQTFQMDYLIKLQPQTFGTYDFSVVVSNSFRICRIAITHIGRNFPCTEMPGSTAQSTDNVQITWKLPTGGKMYDCNASATVSFRSLTNWGRDPVVPDLHADDDSIMISVWYQVCQSNVAGGVPIPYTFNYGPSPAQVSGSTTINVILEKFAYTSAPVTNVTFESLIGPPDIIHKNIPKLLRFNMSIPAKFQNSITFLVENKDFDNNVHVDFCGIALTHSGANVPCISPNYTVASLSSDTTVFNDMTVYSSIQLFMQTVCYTPSSSDPNESVIVVEVGVRVKDYVTDGTSVQLGISVFAGDLLGYNQAFTFTVRDLGPINTTNISISELDPSDVLIYTDSSLDYGLNLTISYTAWITYIIQIPPESITPAQLSVLSPSSNGRPIVHIRDVQFAPCNGNNILCVSPNVDLQRTYRTNFVHSGNIRTFMGIDSVTVDMGYLVNAGFTYKWGANIDADNQFAIRVQIQMSDADVTSNLYTNYLYTSIRVGDVIVVGSQKLNVLRNSTALTRRCCERANLLISMNQTNPKSYVYNAGDLIYFETQIKHTFDPSQMRSQGEGWPLAKMRIIAPSYIKYVQGVNDFSSNYTNGSVYVSNDTTIFAVEFEFDRGILFPDLISFNFSLSVDPDKERPIGSGIVVASVVMAPICLQSNFSGFPTNSTTWVNCGGMVSETLTSIAPDCFDPINIPNNCQITGSSMMSSLTAPYLAIDPLKAWSPALREGSNWNEYLQFNFGGVARINKVRIGNPTSVGTTGLRQVTKVRLESSNDCNFFTYILETAIPADNIITLPTAVETLNVRIVITGADPANPDTKPLGLNNIQFYGCLPYSEKYSCCADNTVDASNVTEYRHYAVDAVKKIIYFCDLKNYIDGMFCYYTSRAPPVTENTWTELPRYVVNIEGFSKSTGQTYFKTKADSYVSTIDGSFFVTASSIPADIVKSLVVPGTGATSPDVPFPGTTFKANYQGIWDQKFLLAEWVPCCKP